MADKLYGDVVADTVDLSIDVVLRSSTDSTAVTGVASGSVTARYYRQGAAASTAVTTSALAAANSAHADGGWREIDATNFPGRYRFDLPDAAIAAGADWVGVQIRVSGAFNFDANYRIQTSALFPDQVLKRNWASMTDDVSTTRCMWNALRALRNRWVLTPTAYSVKKEDDNTEAWNATVSTTSGASPVTAIDPA